MFDKLNWLEKKELIKIIRDKNLKKYFEKEVDLKIKERAMKDKKIYKFVKNMSYIFLAFFIGITGTISLLLIENKIIEIIYMISVLVTAVYFINKPYMEKYDTQN